MTRPSRLRDTSRFPSGEKLSDLHVAWTLATTGPNGAPLSIETESIVVPDKSFALKRAAGAIAADADLADWAPRAFSVRAPGELDGHGDYSGASDASFSWDVRHTADAVHFAVQVRDDDVVSTPTQTLREQDHVVINIDARPEADRNKNMDYLVARLSGELTKQITTFCGVQQKPIADPILAMFAPSTGKARIACAARRTSDGYAVEVSVPDEQLDERRGASWDALRLNVELKSTLKRLKLLPALFRKVDVEKLTPHAAVFLSRAGQKGLVYRLNRGN